MGFGEQRFDSSNGRIVALVRVDTGGHLLETCAHFDVVQHLVEVPLDDGRRITGSIAHHADPMVADSFGVAELIVDGEGEDHGWHSRRNALVERERAAVHDGGGRILNSEGAVNEKAVFRKPARWVDYSGPVEGDTVGVTIHDHPSSFGHPCRWHVRTYGLFAANPFGVHHFTKTKKTNGIVLKEGTEMRLNYRVVLYEGEFDSDAAAKDSEQYANDPRPELE